LSITHAPADYWNRYFRAKDDEGEDLDWGGRWTEPFIPWLTTTGARDILELGCGTGNDAARLASQGFAVTATDYSIEAIERARQRYHDRTIDFRVVDMTERLPFSDLAFDAVMSNVSAHMFSDEVTRSLIGEVSRVLKLSGLLLLHVNADDDRPLRETRRRVRRELEHDYVLEESGQTVRFFSRGYLLSVLSGWEIRELTHVEISHEETREPFKRIWRVVASNIASPSAERLNESN
jgi:SAM-dependent methyltransferase